MFYVADRIGGENWRIVQKFEHRQNFNEHGKMDTNKKQNIYMEDEPSATTHQDATVSKSEDEVANPTDFPPPLLTLERHDTSPHRMTAANIKELWDHIKNWKKRAQGHENGDEEETEVEPADETMAEYYDSDMDFPGEDSDVD